MLDNALYQCLIDEADLGDLFAGLPSKYAALRPLLDGRAEAGSESIARLLLKNLGCSVQVQVQIDGVGRVDLLIDGWIVVECDSRAHHAGWEAQERDRLRDLLLAERGYVVIRPTASMIFSDPELCAVPCMASDPPLPFTAEDTTQETCAERSSGVRSGPTDHRNSCVVSLSDLQRSRRCDVFGDGVTAAGAYTTQESGDVGLPCHLTAPREARFPCVMSPR